MAQNLNTFNKWLCLSSLCHFIRISACVRFSQIKHFLCFNFVSEKKGYMTLYYVEYQCFCIYLFFFPSCQLSLAVVNHFFFVTMNCHIEYISAF